MRDDLLPFAIRITIRITLSVPLMTEFVLAAKSITLLEVSDNRSPVYKYNVCVASNVQHKTLYKFWMCLKVQI